MPKPVALTPSLVEAPQLTPQASTPARSPKPENAPAAKADQMPLQVRWPRADVRAVKIAAAENEQTISEFMLACFHEHMINRKA